MDKSLISIVAAVVLLVGFAAENDSRRQKLDELSRKHGRVKEQRVAQPKFDVNAPGSILITVDSEAHVTLLSSKSGKLSVEEVPTDANKVNYGQMKSKECSNSIKARKEVNTIVYYPADSRVFIKQPRVGVFELKSLDASASVVLDIKSCVISGSFKDLKISGGSCRIDNAKVSKFVDIQVGSCSISDLNTDNCRVKTGSCDIDSDTINNLYVQAGSCRVYGAFFELSINTGSCDVNAIVSEGCTIKAHSCSGRIIAAPEARINIPTGHSSSIKLERE